MALLVALFVDGDPIGVGVVDVLAGGVRIGASHHVHAQLAAAAHDVAKGVHVAQPLAAVLQRNFSGIERDAASGAQAGGIGVDSLKIIEPEGKVIIPRVIFYEGQLRPAHGAVVPSWVAAAGCYARERRGASKKLGGGNPRRLLEKSSPVARHSAPHQNCLQRTWECLISVISTSGGRRLKSPL